MRCQSIGRLALMAVLAGIMLGGSVPADVPAPPGDQEVDTAPLKPRWKVGDRWVVETATLQVQASNAREAGLRGTPVRWQFTVEAIEKLAGRDCYRLRIRSLLPGRQQPVTTLWLDRRSLALRMFQTQLPLAGGFRTVTESYQFSGDQASPVMSPLTALPLDVPLFLGGRIKGSQSFRYEAISGPPGQKAVGDIGFGFEVRQSFSRPEAAHVKGLVNEAFAKSIQTRPAVEVRLDSFDRQVRQLWQPGSPWPVYTDNGTTVARLIKVIPAP